MFKKAMARIWAGHTGKQPLFTQVLQYNTFTTWEYVCLQWRIQDFRLGGHTELSVHHLKGKPVAGGNRKQ